MTGEKGPKDDDRYREDANHSGDEGSFRPMLAAMLAHADFTRQKTCGILMGIGLFIADNAIHQHPATDLTAMNLRRDAAGHHGERGRLRVRPRQGREINLMRMPVDVHVDEHPPLPDGAEQLIREPFETELRRCCRAIDGDDRRRVGELVHLPHAHAAHAERNDGNQRHPDSRQDSPAD